MIRTLIIADNAVAKTVMKQLSSQVRDIEVMGACSNAIETLDFQLKQPVDLLLLDIEMPELNGLQLIKSFGNERPVIIFTTSKKDYASEAFNLNVADYIVKPVSSSRFRQAIDKARAIIENRRIEVKWTDRQFIFVKDSSVIRKLMIDDIHFMEAMGDYVKIFIGQKFHTVHISLKRLEEKLSERSFVRIHRSYIIALNKIDVIEDGVIVIAGTPLPVSNFYRKDLHRRLDII